MNQFGSDDKAENGQEESDEVVVPKPNVDFPKGFTPLVPGSTLSDLEDLPESFDEDDVVKYYQEDEASEESEIAGKKELEGPDVESIFAKVVAESEDGESGEEEESEDFEPAPVGGVAFNVPKVKPVMLSAASVYGAPVEEETVELESVVGDESADEEGEKVEESLEDEIVVVTDEEIVGEAAGEDDALVAEEELPGDDNEGISAEEGDDAEPAEDEVIEEVVSEIVEEEEVVQDDDGDAEEEVGGDDDEEVIAFEEDEKEEEPVEEEVLEEVVSESEEEEVVVEDDGDDEKSVLESLAEGDELEEVAEKFSGEEDDDEDEEEVEQKIPDAAVVAGLVAKAKAKEKDSDVNEMEVMDPERKKTRELFQPEEKTSRWAFWRRPSKRDQQLARVSEGYLEMVDMVRAIRNQMNSQNENNLILRDSLSHLPEAMKGLESFSKSQRTVGKALKEIHGQLRNSGSKDQKLIESMTGFNDTLKGMDDTGKETMKTFDRVQERMRDSDIRMENLFQNVQNSEEKVSETMVRLQRNMANMQLIFLFCFMVVIGVLVYTVMGNNAEKEKPQPKPVNQESVVTPSENN